MGTKQNLKVQLKLIQGDSLIRFCGGSAKKEVCREQLLVLIDELVRQMVTMKPLYTRRM